MYQIIYSVKNIIFIIVASEFLKNFLCSEKYKKYVSVSINILVIAFLLMQLKGIRFETESLEAEKYICEYSNQIKSDYEKNVIINLKKEYEKNNIYIKNIILETDKLYNIVSLKIYPEKKSDCENIKRVTEGLGLNKYEIIEDN